jgi:hypothetical protein
MQYELPDKEYQAGFHERTRQRPSSDLGFGHLVQHDLVGVPNNVDLTEVLDNWTFHFI